MVIQKVADNAAFSQGAGLWVIPDAKHSQWARKIDWYLNFQLTRADAHRPPALADGLKELLGDEGLSQPTLISDMTKPLLIASHYRLPAQQTVTIPYKGSLKPWLQTVARVWQGLGSPALRIFAPKDVKPDLIAENWPKEAASGDIAVVGEWN